ncbi:MAG: YdeI/OmpD-associated family protein [Pseudoxanthomonas sp.]
MVQHDPRIDAYIAQAAEFARPILSHLRAAVHAGCSDVEETIKWSHPHFLYRGRILCSMAAFKQHAAFGFFLGAPVPAGDDGKRGQAMGQFGRIEKIADLPSKKIFNDGLAQSMRSIEAGAKRPVGRHAKPKPPADVPDDLAAALHGNREAQAAFDAFSPGYRREYVEWVVEAKRAETRQRRIAQAVEWIAEGKTRNWKYMSC